MLWRELLLTNQTAGPGYISESKLYTWGVNTVGQLGYASGPITFSIAQLSAGAGHFAAITSDGKLLTWGLGSSGQLGNNDLITRSAPTQVGSSSWSTVSAGNSFTTAITIDGKLFIWGTNAGSILGTGDAVNRSSPTQIGTGLSWTSVSSGVSHSVAKAVDHTLYAWGLNNAGQLGTTDTLNRSSPTQVNTSSWTSVSAGGSYTAAIDTLGKLYTWGLNNVYQMGDNTTINKSSITQVASGTSWSQISAGVSHSLAIDSVGGLYTWGQNTSIGINNETKSWTALALGTVHGAAIRSDGLLFTWGNNTAGQLGDNTAVTKSSPVQVGTSSWSKVDAGTSLTVAIRSDGTLWAWGLGTSGQLGDNTAITKSSPVQIGLATDWNNITVGPAYTIATTNVNTAYAWGVNGTGQLGINNSINRSSPVQVTTALAASWTTISAGTDYALGIASTGALYGWGNNTVNQAGLYGANIPYQMASLMNGSFPVMEHGGYIRRDGTLFMWGYGEFGQIGNNATNNRSSPVQVAGSWNQIACATYTTHGIKSDGTLWSWGSNAWGQLGTNNAVTYSSPIQVGTDTWRLVNTFLDSATNTNQAYGIKSDFTLWGWGGNGSNNLFGDPALPTVNRSSPTQIGTASWAMVSGQIGIRVDGTMWSWGANNNGQAGLNDTINRSSMTQIGSASNWVTVNGGLGGFFISPLGQSYFAINTLGELYAWGNNSRYQLGLGNDTLNRSNPTKVGSSSWVAVSNGGSKSMGVDVFGRLYIWGQTSDAADTGFFGVSTLSQPVQIFAGTSFVAVSSKFNSAKMASAVTGGFYTWGNGGNGILANGTTINRSSPTLVGALPALTGSVVTTSASAPTQVFVTPFSTIQGSWAAVAAGQSHSLAITADRKLYAWGLNNAGQLGDISITNRTSYAVQIPSSWSQVNAGVSVSSAIRTDGALFAWGLGTSGELGTNTAISRSIPTQVGTSSYTSVIAGSNLGAIRIDNTVYTWGLGTGGQTGHTDALSRSNPTQLGSVGLYLATFVPTKIGTSSWTKVSAGTSASLAVRNDGTVWAWGLGTTGQLGLGDVITRSSPSQISASSAPPTDASSNSFTIDVRGGAILSTETPFSPGVGGDSTFSKSVFFDGIGDALTVAGNSAFAFGTGDFTIECWVNTSSTTGTLFDTRSGSTGVTPLLYFTSSILGYYINGTNFINASTALVANTWYHVALVRNAGSSRLYLNGSQTGSTYTDTNNFTSTNVIYIGIANDGSNALTGYISNLRVVKGTAVYTTTFTPSTTLLTATQSANVNGNPSVEITSGTSLLTLQSYSINNIHNNVAAGLTIGAAIRTNGLAYTWGLGTSGQIGNNAALSRSNATLLYANPLVTLSSPVLVGNSSWSAVSAGASHTLAVKSGGTLWDWGGNSSGQLGLTTDSINRSSPVQVGASSWTALNSGSSYSMAIRSDGTLWAWGNSGNAVMSQLGTAAEQVRWKAVTQGIYVVLAVKSDGTLWSWGGGQDSTSYNDRLTLGLNNASITNKSSPTQIGSLNDWATVGAANGIAAAIKTDGTLWTWGTNTFGRLGLGDTINRSSPTQVTAVDTSWAFVSGNGSHYNNTNITFDVNLQAIDTSGKVYTWGKNSLGQLGQGDNVDRSTPTLLPSPYDTMNFSWVGGSEVVFFLTTTGSLYTVGGHGPYGKGMAGTVIARSNLVQIPLQGSATSWVAAATGFWVSYAIDNTGALYFSGDSGDPNGGTGGIRRSNPTLLSSQNAEFGGKNWQYITGTFNDSVFSSGFLATTTEGQMWYWGQCNGGVIGASDQLTNIAATIYYPTQVQVAGTSATGRFVPMLFTSMADFYTKFSFAPNRAAYVRPDGHLMIWGTERYDGGGGQFGENTYFNTSVRVGPYMTAASPMYTSSLSSPVQIGSGSWAVVAGGKINTAGTGNAGFVAIDSTSALYAWGSNEYLQLGTNDIFDRVAPTKIGNSSWNQVSISGSHTLAIRSDGALFAWGINTSGRLGTNDLLTRSSPTLIGTSSWSQISAGQDHSLGIDSTGKLYGWGNNLFGATGVITSIASWTQLSEGLSFVLAIRSDGTLWSWGAGSSGRLGLGDTFNRSSPTQIGTSSWTQAYASIGSSYAAAIRSDGTMWAWGTNANFELGDGTTVAKSSPVQVLGTSSWSQLSLGTTHGLAVTTTGELYGWGQSTGLYSSTAPFSWTQVSEGKSHTVAIRQDGLLFTWGNNNAGQLGDGTTITKSSPTQIGTSSWTSVSAGASHTLAIRSDGMLFAWGLNSSYQLGNNSFGSDRSSPIQVSTTSFTSIAAGDFHSLGVDDLGKLYGWGLAVNGQLAAGNTTPLSWSSIAAGYSYGMGVSTDNLFTWGVNVAGQLGNLTTINRSSPVLINSGNSWSLINGGDSHAAAIASDKSTYVWGLNTSGQLGNGTTINQSKPVQIISDGFSFTDSSSFNNLVIKQGVLISYSTTIVPFAGSVSGSGFGVNQFIYIPGTGTTWLSDLGDFTWEAWIYPTSFNGPSNSCAIISCGILPSTGDDIMLRANPTTATTTTLGLYAVNAAAAGFLGAGGGINGGTVRLNQWQHVAAVRRSGIFYLYLNGVEVATDSAQIATSLRTTSTNLTVGKGFANGTNDYFIGYISNVRIVNGLAVYTGAFTTPTAITTDTQSSSTNIAEITATTTDILLLTTPAASINTTPAGNYYDDISAGLNFTGGVDTVGRLYMWGLGTSGQLGIGTATSRSLPTQVTSGTSSYVQISAGASTAAAIDTLGQLWVWGAAATGQLGQGNVALVNQSLPVQVASGTSWSQVSNGPSHTLAVRSDGSLWAWGLGTTGQLGNNAVITRSSPVQVGVDTNWLAASAGGTHSLALKTDYTLWGWGASNLGQAGFTSLINISNPVQIGTSSWSQISAGIDFSLGKDINGTVYGWGQDTSGQLGI
jgi:alpha-tubulin suppressor-like RCC1 family protein